MTQLSDCFDLDSPSHLPVVVDDDNSIQYEDVSGDVGVEGQHEAEQSESAPKEPVSDAIRTTKL